MPMPSSMPVGRASSVAVRRASPPRPVLLARHSLGALPFEHEALEVAVLLRHSAPAGSAFSPSSSGCSSTGKPLAPECVLASTDVRVTGVAQRAGHCEFALEVDTGFGAPAVLYKRYSELRDFRAELLRVVAETKTHCGLGPCAQLAQLSQIKFPRRRLRLPGTKQAPNLAVAQARVPLLQRFLQATLRVYRMASRRQMRVCTNARCVLLGLIKRFLNVSEPVVVEEEQDATMGASYEPTMPTPIARCFPELAFTTLYGDKPAPLFPIAEDPEPVAATE